METTVTPNPEIRGGIDGLGARVCFGGRVVRRVAGGRVLVRLCWSSGVRRPEGPRREKVIPKQCSESREG